MVAGTPASVRRLVGAVRTRAHRALDTVPTLRRAVEDLVRVEVVDRAMVIAAQALLALLPLVVVLSVFLPSHLTQFGVDRFEAVTGIGEASSGLVLGRGEALSDGLPAGAEEWLDPGAVRTQTGLVGLVVTVLSASSFARALQRMYERVFGLRHVGGLRGRRRCLGWLLGWLVGLQLLAGIGVLTSHARTSLGAAVVLAPVWFLLQAVLVALLWWWSLHTLLTGRVGWAALVVPALLTGVAVTGYVAGSGVVMGPYAASAARQFGSFGLVLAIATWLVGIAAVWVVAAVLGRVLGEDPWLERWAGRLRRWVPLWRAGSEAGSGERDHSAVRREIWVHSAQMTRPLKARITRHHSGK